MSAIGERDDDFFDFSDQIISDFAPLPEVPKQEETKNAFSMNSNEVQTSYFLVNALMSLLISKGIIRPDEIQSIVSDLYVDYIKKKKGAGPSGNI